MVTVWYNDEKVTELVTATPRMLAGKGEKAPSILILRTGMEERLAEASVVFLPY
jgi:hypothetical protein